MRFIKPDINIDFIGKKKIAFFLSIICVAISVLSLIFHGGPRLGIDFAGGTLVQIKFKSAVRIDDIKAGLNTVDLGTSSVQQFGQDIENEFLIRTEISYGSGEGFTSDIQTALQASTQQEVEIRRVEMVGPQVGKDLREKALFAIFYALLFITIYISGRFELKWILSGVVAAALIGAVYIFDLFSVSIPFLISAALIVTLVIFWFLELKYAMGAIVALIHDVIITIGIFSIFDKEFTLPIIAALLTI
ncbi:MAG: protein translocase subunit SecF, partial [Desulfobacterales bacterium]